METAVRDWNEEVMKWLAVGVCLAMVEMILSPSIGPNISSTL